MSLKEKLLEDQKDAMRRKETIRLSTVRMVRAAVTNAEIDKGHELDDEEVLAVIARDVKRHQDSIAEFTKGKRQDLLEKEEAELAILFSYLPQQLSSEEIAATARTVIEQVGAKGPSDMGKVMAVIVPKLKGKADSRTVSQVVQKLLAGQA